MAAAAVGLVLIAVSLVSVTDAVAAPQLASAKSPQPLRLVCAHRVIGVLRFVRSSSACDRRSESAVRFHSRARVRVCVAVGPAHPGEYRENEVEPDGDEPGVLRKVAGPRACRFVGAMRRPRDRYLVLPARDRVELCAPRGNRVLHYVLRLGRCRSGGVRLYLAGTRKKRPTPAVNHPPVAMPDRAQTTKRSAVSIAVLANDRDRDNDALHVAALGTDGTKGRVSVVGDNVSYDPAGAFNDLRAGQTATDRFTYVASDGRRNSNPGTVTVTITGADEAPVVTSFSPLAPAYVENSAPVVVDGLVTVTDADSPQLQGATVAITDGRRPDDVLHFANQNGITGGYDAGTGVLSLTGVASVSDYQAALRSVTFENTGEEPGSGRTFMFTATDGVATSAPARRDIPVTSVNDAPVNAVPGPQTTDEDTARRFSPADGNAISVDDADAGSQDLRVDLSAGHGALALGDASGLTTVTGEGTAGVSLEGSRSALGAALDGLTYTPDPNYNGDDALSITTDDQGHTGTGGPLTAQDTVPITVTSVDDAPVVTTTAGSATFTEGDASAAVDDAVSVTDADSAQLSGATVTIAAPGFDSAHDALAFTAVGSITGGYDTSTGVLTLTGPGTLAEYQQALRSVSFSNSDEDPAAASTGRTIRFVVTDDTNANSDPADRGLTIAPVNDAPTLDANPGGGSASFTEGDDPGPPVAPALTLGDVDSAQMASATVRITGNYDDTTDELAFTDQNGITGTYDTATGTLTLTGPASKADFQAALRSVTFRATGENPDGATRTVQFVVSDGDLDSGTGGTSTRGVTVTPVNDAPTVTTGASHASYTERAAAVAVDPALELADPDSASLQGATVKITGNLDASNDQLEFDATPNITGAYNTGTGTLTLVGTDTTASYQAALRSVRFASTSHTPSATRTIQFVATDDGGLDSAPATQTVDITPVNDAPTLDANPGGGSASFTEGDDPGPAVAPALTLDDVDSAQIASATVQITGNFASATDELAFTDQNGITGAYNGATGVLSLTGPGSKADFQAALRSVTFRATGDNPSGATRTVQFVVSDGDVDSGTGASSTRDVTVTPVNDPPTVTTTAGNATWTEGNPPAPVDGALQVTDPDSVNLAGATVEISSTTFQTGDTLELTPSGNVTGSYNPATHTLSLSGTDTLAAYQTVLRSVAFSNTTTTPGATTRRILFTVDDGSASSSTAHRDVDVSEVNSKPVVQTSAGDTAFTEGSGPVTVDAGLNVSDSDSPTLAGATVQITANLSSAQDSLAYTAPSGNPVTAGLYDPIAGMLTLSGSATAAQYQAALRAVTFDNTSDNPGVASRTVRFRVDDGSSLNNLSDTGANSDKNVTVTRTNDAPTVMTSSGASVFTEKQVSTTFVDAALAVSDVDSATLASATVNISAATYQAGQDVLDFTDTANITGSYAAGTLTLTGADSVANYESALRSVSYRNTSNAPNETDRAVEFSVNDGAASSANALSQRTKTVQVVSVNDAPVLGPGGQSTTFTEGNTATPSAAEAISVAPSLTASDDDTANLTGATVQITGGYQSAEDKLSFASPTNGVSGTVNATGDTVTLSGNRPVSDYEAALRAVKYRNAGNTPNTGDRTITFIADDGQPQSHESNHLDWTLHVVATNDAPAAAPQSFTGTKRAVGNTTLRVHDPANGGSPTVTGPSKDVQGNLETGAADPDGPVGAITVVAATAKATAKGGSVDILADGDFVYHPPKGFTGDDTTGNDTFSYTLDDHQSANNTGNGTVTVNVQDMVWYVDASAPAPPAGTAGESHTPLQNLSGINGAGGAGDADASGDRIFLHPGTYTGGLPLESGQQLMSKRHGLVVPDGGGGAGTYTLATASPGGGASTVQGGVVLNSGNTIQGVAFGATGSSSTFALSGSSVGTATINTVTSGALNNPDGGAVNIGGSNNTLNMKFSAISSAGSSTNAIAIQDASGTFTDESHDPTDPSDPSTVPNGTISNATLTDVTLTGGSLDFKLNSAISDSSSQLVNVSGETGGTKDFNGKLTGGSVALAGNTGATIRFDGGMTLSSGTTTGFSAAGGGTLAVTDPAGVANNTIASTAGGALDVQNTTIGVDNLTFERLSSNGASRGIVLNNTGASGSLVVTGNGGACDEATAASCSGGEIRSGTGADDSGTTPAGTGIVLNSTKSPSFTRMYLHDFDNYAIRGNDVRGFTLDASVVSGANGTTSGVATPYFDGSVYFNNLTGSALVQNSVIGGGRHDTFKVVNATTLDLNRLTFSGVTMRDTTSADSNDSINLQQPDSPSVTGKFNVTVQNSTFSATGGDHFQLSQAAPSSSDVVFINNTLSNNSPRMHNGGAGGVNITGGGSASGFSTLTANVSNNTSKDAEGPAFVITKNLGTSGSGGAYTVTFDNNTVGLSGAANSGSAGGSGLQFTSWGWGTMTGTITTNSIRAYENYGMDLQAGAGQVTGGNVNMTINGNTITQPSGDPAGPPFAGIHVNSGVTAGDSFNTCVNFGANTVTGSGNATPVDVRVRQRQSTTIRLPGYGGANNDTAAVQSFVQGKLGGTPSVSASVNLPAGGGFTGAGTTTCP